jgi:outer membrane lipoprotein-sorting protein
MKKIAIIVALMLVLGVVFISGCTTSQNNTTGMQNQSLSKNNNTTNSTNATKVKLNETLNNTIKNNNTTK